MCVNYLEILLQQYVRQSPISYATFFESISQQYDARNQFIRMDVSGGKGELALKAITFIKSGFQFIVPLNE